MTTRSATAPSRENQGQAGGSPPGDGSTSGETVSREQFVAARQKITDQAEMLAGYRDIMQVMSQNPEWTFEQVQHYVKTGQVPVVGTEADERLEKILGGFKDEVREPLKEALAIVREQTRSEVEARMRPVVQRSQATAAEAAYNEGLADGGLPPDVRQDPLFQEMEADLANEGWFQTLRKAHPGDAGKLIAERFSQTQGYADQQRQVQRARDRSLTTGGGRAGPASRQANATKLPRTASMRDILNAHRRGVDIEFTD
jgi:hypothetical protein